MQMSFSRFIVPLFIIYLSISCAISWKYSYNTFFYLTYDYYSQKNIAIVNPPRASEYALCYVLYNDHNASKRNEFIQKAALVGLEAEHVKQCLVIAKNVDREDQNYHFIGLME